MYISVAIQNRLAKINVDRKYTATKSQITFLLKRIYFRDKKKKYKIVLYS